jgi:hypothetical protein
MTDASRPHSLYYVVSKSVEPPKDRDSSAIAVEQVNRIHRWIIAVFIAVHLAAASGSSQQSVCNCILPLLRICKHVFATDHIQWPGVCSSQRGLTFRICFQSNFSSEGGF